MVGANRKVVVVASPSLFRRCKPAGDGVVSQPTKPGQLRQADRQFGAQPLRTAFPKPFQAAAKSHSGAIRRILFARLLLTYVPAREAAALRVSGGASRLRRACRANTVANPDSWEGIGAKRAAADPSSFAAAASRASWT
jgi:hypothetical protein